MIDINRSKSPGQYAVSIGHTRVVVDSVSPEEAIKQARSGKAAVKVHITPS